MLFGAPTLIIVSEQNGLDAIGINRWNQVYKDIAVYKAAKAMADPVSAGSLTPQAGIFYASAL